MNDVVYIEILSLVMYLTSYFSFRSGVYSYLRYNKMSKTNINKSRKGFVNYWWYELINSKFSLGKIYYMNIIVTILMPIYATLVFVTAKFETLYIPTAVLSFVICCILLPMYVFGAVYETLREYGCTFVIIRKNKHGSGGRFSTLSSYLFYMLVVICCVVNWILVFKM